METDASATRDPNGPEESVAGASLSTSEGAAEGPAVPSVVAVVVTQDPGPWFEATLAALDRQDYPTLTVLVIDAGSEEDPTPRVASVLPHAYVRRTERVGIAAAANEALEAVEGAAFLLFCHDDVVADDNAARLLVEEAFRSNAAVLGPKLVAVDNPNVLQEVGLAIDRFGAPFSGIEPGELDQEQHDGVRDVFFVPSAMMLVRADLFRELGGFDPLTYPGAEDLDLCWRGRLLGARVLVVPDARVGHHRAEDERPRGERGELPVVMRNRVRAVLKSSSVPTLCWTVPIGLLLAFLESLVFVVSGRRKRAEGLVVAWFAPLAGLGEFRRSRRAIQKTRTVNDNELRYLQVRGSARLTASIARRLHAEDRILSVTSLSRGFLGNAARSARRPLGVATAVFALAYLLGSRALIVGRIAAVGSFLPWTSVTSLGATFGSAWRYSGLGHDVPSSSAFAFLGAFSSVFVGRMALAQTVLVVGALPLGAYGVYRATRSISPSPVPAAGAALAYAVNPVVRNMLATGRLGPLVFFALAPFVFSVLLHAAGTEIGMTGSSPEWRVPRRMVVVLGVLVAVVGAVFPSAILLVLLIGAMLWASGAIVGESLLARRLGLTAVAGSACALVLLLPWPLALIGGGGRNALGWVFRPNVDLAAILQFQTGPSGSGWLGWGLLIAAVSPLLLGTGIALAWAARAWMITIAGFAVVWIPSRFWSSSGMPAPEGPLVLAALGIAIAVGIGLGVFVDDLRRTRFGWQQFVAVSAVVVLAGPTLGFVGDITNGRWHQPEVDWHTELAFMQAAQKQGQFRVLWLGNPSVLPVDPALRPNDLGYALTRNGSGDVSDLWPAPTRGADALVSSSIDLLAASRTNRFGRLVAALGVRYIVVADRRGPSASVVAPQPTITASLADQLDLTKIGLTRGVTVYENNAWAPMSAVATGDNVETVRTSIKGVDPNSVMARSDLSGLSPLLPRGTMTADVPAGELWWAESSSTKWRAEVAGTSLRRHELFGWLNGFEVDRPGRVTLSYTGQTRHNLVIAGVVALWLAVMTGLWTTRQGNRVRRGSERVSRRSRLGRSRARMAEETTE